MTTANQVDSTQTPATSPSERRRNLRFAFTATVESIETKTGAKVIGRTSDLSLGGCYVDTLSPFPVGTEAQVRIVRENETFEAQVKVIYSSVGMGMGLAFVSAHPKQVRLFQKWLLEISGQPIPGEVSPSQNASGQGGLPQVGSETAETEKSQTLKNAVLSDLIMTLMQKKVLTQGEGKDLLRKLFR
ncbi:MAG TPA: PilZ domain-containing protein [Candidatus Acidoferrales bacterium]|jgi:hypothetical protein